MTDLDHRMRSLDRMRPPDLWTDIRTREPDRHPAATDGRRRILAAGVALVVSAAAIGFAIRTFTGGDSSPTVRRVEILPKANGKIAFVQGVVDRGPEGTADLFVMEPDGSALTRLTNELGDASQPSWSPDGTRIAFVVAYGAGFGSDIFVTGADGAGLTRLTNADEDHTQNLSPTWSPDGSWIAFSSDRSGQSDDGSDNHDIYLMDADGGEVVRLTDHPELDAQPSWSPDGTRIAFARSNNGPAAIYTMRADGSDVRLVTGCQEPRCATKWYPSWSPDGRRIAFIRDADPDYALGVVGVDGTNERIVYPCGPPVCHGLIGSPQWAPDGSKLVFTIGDTSPQVRRQIYAINVDGPQELTQLTTGPDDSGYPTWQPIPIRPPDSGEPNLPTTGAKISFVGREETVSGYSEYLNSVEANGAGFAKVTARPFHGFRYDWSPDGTKIVYDVGISEAEHEIRVLDLATGDETVVFHDVSGQDAERSSTDLFGVFEPAWSPDGTRIAFYSGSGDIYVISVDGSVSTQLTDPADSCGDHSPTWAPDGGSILFSRSCSTGSGYEDEDTIDLYVRDTDGTNEVRISTGIKAFDPSWSPTGEIAFSGVAGDAEGIFTMEPDGTGLTLLTEGENREPAWSPDGSRIAFVSRRDGDAEIHVIDADGSDEFQVTDNASDDRAPGWQPSPQGGEVEPMVPTIGTIAFLSQRDDFGVDIAVVQSDGTGSRKLTDDRMDAGSLSWSPDGTRMAFSVGIGEGVGAIRVLDVATGGVAEILLVEATSPEHELFQPANPTWSHDGAEIWFTAGDGFYTIRPDGTGLRRRLDWDVEECRRTSPAWSPDRVRIAFVRVCVNPDDSYDVPDTFDDLFVVNADGTAETRLTFDQQASDPMWSPDGTRIVFSGATDFLDGGSGIHRIYTINADGTGLTPITAGPADSQPAWSPDGTRIAFVRYLDGNEDIYVMNADGTGLIRLTDEPGLDSRPVWRPDVGDP